MSWFVISSNFGTETKTAAATGEAVVIDFFFPKSYHFLFWEDFFSFQFNWPYNCTFSSSVSSLLGQNNLLLFDSLCSFFLKCNCLSLVILTHFFYKKNHFFCFWSFLSICSFVVVPFYFFPSSWPFSLNSLSYSSRILILSCIRKTDERNDASIEHTFIFQRRLKTTGVLLL